MRNDIERVFGRRLRELRELRRLTQAQLGEACDLSTKYVGALERGEQNPTLRVLDKLASGLAVELPELVRLRHQADAKALRNEIASKSRALSEADLRRVAQIINIFMP